MILAKEIGFWLMHLISIAVLVVIAWFHGRRVGRSQAARAQQAAVQLAEEKVRSGNL